MPAMSPAVDAPLLTIGEVARLASVPITTLRYYESVGLIPAPRRQGGQRRYEPSVLLRLMVIRFGKIAGLSVPDIVAVLDDTTPGRPVMTAIVEAQLVTIDAQMARLGLARRMLTATVACGCEDLANCTCGALGPVIAELRQALAT
jgi:MerR family redox-sensitive transcriptional activator SoxR